MIQNVNADERFKYETDLENLIVVKKVVIFFETLMELEPLTSRYHSGEFSIRNCIACNKWDSHLCYLN